LIENVDDEIEKYQRKHIKHDEIIPHLLSIAQNHLNTPVVILVAKSCELIYKLWSNTKKSFNKKIENELLNYAKADFKGKIPQVKNFTFFKLDFDGKPIGLFGYSTIFEKKTENSLMNKNLAITFCEQIDNYLFSEINKRETHYIKIKIADSLKNKIFSKGLEKAVNLLEKYVKFDLFFLLYFDESDIFYATPKYFIYSEGKIFDPYHYFNKDIHNFILKNSRKLIEEEQDKILKEKFNLHNFQSRFLITGLKRTIKIGKLIISSRTKEIDIRSHEIIQIFIAFVQQRIVDFNKEWRNLSQCFSITHRIKLLENENYELEYLAPKVKKIAILYADLSSFTFFSEQVLKSPENITQLFDIWAKGVINIVWENKGCCDKFVGDCIIAHFGPPFYDKPPETICLNAVKCAIQIRNFTFSLLKRKEKCFSLIKNSGYEKKFGVAIGLNYGKVKIGIIGPNRDFTAFGADMNNTARIQGKANCNEIFLLEPIAKFIKKFYKLEGPYYTKLKNVKNKSKYYKL